MDKSVFIWLVSLFLLSNCALVKTENTSVKLPFSLQFKQEKIIPANMEFQHSVVGGLSSIDYANKQFYAICDDKSNPRFYTFDVAVNSSDKVKIKKVIYFKIDEDVDPESLRFDPKEQVVFWASEGNVRKGIPPAIFKSDTLGNMLKKLPIPSIFRETNNLQHNGTFEGLSLSKDQKSLWIAMELPLKQDGDEPTLTEGNYPIRISKVNKKTGELERQFAYMLGKIPKDSKPAGKFRVNGVPEILSIDDTHFLIIERAYASGYSDGGNTVRIYYIDSSKATDILKVPSLKNANYLPAKKTLLFDFETIRSKLTNGIVDNIEGITFGPKLANGNRTLLVISDDNFRKFSKQLQQILIFEVIKK